MYSLRTNFLKYLIFCILISGILNSEEFKILWNFDNSDGIQYEILQTQNKGNKSRQTLGNIELSEINDDVLKFSISYEMPFEIKEYYRKSGISDVARVWMSAHIQRSGVLIDSERSLKSKRTVENIYFSYFPFPMGNLSMNESRYSEKIQRFYDGIGYMKGEMRVIIKPVESLIGKNILDLNIVYILSTNNQDSSNKVIAYEGIMRFDQSDGYVLTAKGNLYDFSINSDVDIKKNNLNRIKELAKSVTTFEVEKL